MTMARLVEAADVANQPVGRHTTAMNTPAIPGGFLIAVEGIDGAGKTTLARAMHAALSAGTVSVHLSKEPTNGHWGAQLRATAASGRLTPEEELRLLLLDRRQHVDELINPALARGEIVILDRYFFSTAAYQGAEGLDVPGLLAANRAFAPEPDLLLVLDVDPAVGLARVAARGDKPNAFETAENLTRCRDIFNALDDAVKIDASADASRVLAAAMERVVVRIADKVRATKGVTVEAAELLSSALRVV